MERVTIDTRPDITVRLDIRSDHGSAGVVLHNVVDLEVRPRFSNWPYSLAFIDIPERQLDGLAVAISDSQEGQLRCLCASVEVVMR